MFYQTACWRRRRFSCLLKLMAEVGANIQWSKTFSTFHSLTHLIWITLQHQIQSISSLCSYLGDLHIYSLASTHIDFNQLSIEYNNGTKQVNTDITNEVFIYFCDDFMKISLYSLTRSMNFICRLWKQIYCWIRKQIMNQGKRLVVKVLKYLVFKEQVLLIEISIIRKHEKFKCPLQPWLQPFNAVIVYLHLHLHMFHGYISNCVL